MTQFLKAPQTLLDHRANVFHFKTDMLSLPDMLWKSTSMKQMLAPGKFDEKDAAKKL